MEPQVGDVWTYCPNGRTYYIDSKDYKHGYVSLRFYGKDGKIGDIANSTYPTSAFKKHGLWQLSRGCYMENE